VAQPSFHLFTFKGAAIFSPFHSFTFKRAQPSFHLFTFSPLIRCTFATIQAHKNHFSPYILGNYGNNK